MKILTIIGGISANSINKKLLELIKPLSPEDFEFVEFNIASLPFYSQDTEQNAAEPVLALKEKILASSAVLFITPEYNRSIPGVLKNAIDWASRPAGKNIWQDKPAAVLGASGGAIGTFGAQMHLKRILSFLCMRVMYQPEIYFNFAAYVNNGVLADESKKIFQNYMYTFKEWIIQNS